MAVGSVRVCVYVCAFVCVWHRQSRWRTVEALRVQATGPLCAMTQRSCTLGSLRSFSNGLQGRAGDRSWSRTWSRSRQQQKETHNQEGPRSRGASARRIAASSCPDGTWRPDHLPLLKVRSNFLVCLRACVCDGNGNVYLCWLLSDAPAAVLPQSELRVYSTVEWMLLSGFCGSCCCKLPGLLLSPKAARICC